MPLVVRLEGTNVELGKKILAESGLAIIAADNLAPLVMLSTSEVYGDPLRSNECSFLLYGRVAEVGMADEGAAKQALDLDEAEQIASVNRTALIDEVAKAMNGHVSDYEL